MDDIGPTLLDEEQWDLWRSGHPRALTHGASMQAMANELARPTPIEGPSKREDTTPICRTAHKRRRPSGTIRMNKRQRGPVSRRTLQPNIMSYCRRSRHWRVFSALYVGSVRVIGSIPRGRVEYRVH